MSEEKKDTGKRTSIVLNWISVCQDLCGLGFISRSKSSICRRHISHECRSPQIPSPDDAALCRLLCKNGLGGSRCNNCSRIGSVMPNFDEICTATRCDMQFPMQGCSECAEKSSSDEKELFADATGSTTPDWNAMCAAFCKQGQGGSACNCDKLPFLRSD
ncbi:uncharacterized protein LOC134831438 [Culicoides brevitarsis]|uniref:uncharacterized protein LOC134831438 n=1 Tax=Culicoides brevitarsis TaxID=469753 RepID=UPI00307B16B9